MSGGIIYGPGTYGYAIPCPVCGGYGSFRALLNTGKCARCGEPYTPPGTPNFKAALVRWQKKQIALDRARRYGEEGA